MLKEIFNKSEKLKSKENEVEIIKNELKNILNNLDLKCFDFFNYKQMKEFVEKFKYKFNKKKLEELEQILLNKKIKEYPKLNKVHYYPILDNIDFMSEKEKKEIDNLLKQSCKNLNKRKQLNDLNRNIIQFLINNKLIEKIYVFKCDCSSFDCDETKVSQSELDKYKEYWEKECNEDRYKDYLKENSEKLNYGVISIHCCNGYDKEICNEKEFFENLFFTEFKVLQKPDLTLDLI